MTGYLRNFRDEKITTQVLFITTFLLVLCPAFISWITDVKYIAIAFSIILLGFVVNIRLNTLDRLVFCFTLFCGFSILWASNISLTLSGYFPWLSGFFIMILAKYYFTYNSNINTLAIISSISLILIVLLSYPCLSSGELVCWNRVFGENKNYISGYLISLLCYPLILITKNHNRWLIVGQVGLACLIFYILLLTNAVGCIISFLVVGVVLYSGTRSFRRNRFLNIFFCVFAICVLLFCFYYLLVVPEGEQPFGFALRYDIILVSLDIFYNHPIMGVGWGNWATIAYEHDKLIGYLIPDVLIDVSLIKHHTLFFKILSELGIIGVFLYIAPIAYSFRELIKSYRSNVVVLLMLSQLIIFLINSSIYVASFNWIDHLSINHAFFFISLGYLSSQRND